MVVARVDWEEAYTIWEPPVKSQPALKIIAATNMKPAAAHGVTAGADVAANRLATGEE